MHMVNNIIYKGNLWYWNMCTYKLNNKSRGLISKKTMGILWVYFAILLSQYELDYFV